MSIFKSILSDLGETPNLTRVSFGGGFQIPKASEKKQENPTFSDQSRQTASFKQTDPNAGKRDLISSINHDLANLRTHSDKVAEIRVKLTTDFPPQQLNSLEEIEKLRIIHQEKAKILEIEYQEEKKKNSHSEKIPKKDVLKEFQEYKKQKNPPKFNFNYEYEEKVNDDDRVTLLKWIFSKLDTNFSGLIEKHEMLKEIADNEELRSYFNIEDSLDLVEDLDRIIPAEFLNQSDFIKFFLSIKRPEPDPRKKADSENIQKKAPLFFHDEENPKNNQEYPTVVLTHRQLDLLEKVFKETDIHGDMVVQKFEYLQSLRTDDDVIKILDCNCIEIDLGNFITLEEALDRVQESGDLYDYITYSQFLNSLSEMFPKKIWIPSENPSKLLLDPLYLQILQDIFDSLPRKGKNLVSSKHLIDSLKEDPQVHQFFHIKITESDTFSSILSKIDKNSAKVISWEDFIDFFSEKGKPDLKVQESTLVNRGHYHALKKDFFKENQSSSPGPSTKAEKTNQNPEFFSPSLQSQNFSKHKSTSALKFTVPAPFEFEQREKQKSKSIRQQKFESYIWEKQREEENHLKYHSIPVPVPAEVSVPKYNTMVAAQEHRRNQVKANSKKITQEREKPFQFYLREMNKPKIEEAKQEFYQFKAKPPPASNSIPLYEHMSRKLEEERKSRIEQAAKKALEEAKLPGRMERYAKGDKNLSVPPPVSSLFKAKKPPEFSKLWDNLGKDLEKKKGSFQPTQPKEFNLTEAKKKSKNENESLNEELIKKGFISKNGPSDPAKVYLDPSKKQLEIEENAKKRREELKKEKEDKAKEREIKENAEKERVKSMNEKAMENKEKLIEKIKANSQPRNLTSIKMKMKERGIAVSDIIGETDGFIDINAEDLV